MTVDDILTELPNLQSHEREAVFAKLGELIREELFKDIGQRASEPARENGTDMPEDWIGSIDDLPEDFAVNHDHYIHGAPKRW
jgi:hypothetical protein